MLGGGDSDTVQRVEETELCQLAHCMWQDTNANAELLDRSFGLVDVHVVDVSVEQQLCDGHAAGASANDGDPHTLLEKYGRPAQTQ